MPITINGSGTVTGITAGGLPDGVITTDDIAASAITRAKMGYAGAILQVVNATYSTTTSNSTSTYADTGLSATITPTSSSSKILVFVTQAGCGKENGNINSKIWLKLMRGSTDICTFEKSAGFTLTDVRNYIGACSTTYLDSPATTSAVTYKTQFKNDQNAVGVYLQAFSETSTITLMEVAA